MLNVRPRTESESFDKKTVKCKTGKCVVFIQHGYSDKIIFSRLRLVMQIHPRE